MKQITALRESLQKRQMMISRTCLSQDLATHASLVVAYKLAKHKPFSDGEFVRVYGCYSKDHMSRSGNAAQECFFVQENYSAPCWFYINKFNWLTGKQNQEIRLFFNLSWWKYRRCGYSANAYFHQGNRQSFQCDWGITVNGVTETHNWKGFVSQPMWLLWSTQVALGQTCQYHNRWGTVFNWKECWFDEKGQWQSERYVSMQESNSTVLYYPPGKFM